MSITYSGNDKYDSKAVNKSIDVDNIKLIVDNLVKYYGGLEKLVIALVDHDGGAISSKNINIKINGVNYSRTTGADGTASIAINLISGSYTASVDAYEYSLSREVNVEILPTIYASDVLKVFRNSTQYCALFLDVNGNPLIDVNVSFNINGVFYTRTTNESGYAKLNINLDEGTYILTAINSINGEMKSNNITVIGLIESSDLTKYYKNQSQFIIRLIDSDGSYLGAGEKVTFNINGIFYTRITNETGHVCLNINLNPGNYIITTEYKECFKSNNIKVLPVLSAKNMIKKYGSPDQFVATLVDGQGKAFKNQVIGFNINGVFYNRITDNNGQAKLNINLMAGEYIITSSFNECYIVNTIKVTA